jgi:acetyl esterase/lipase
MKASHEAAPVAEWLNSLGISAFVLDYRVAPYRHPIPLSDARRAIQMVRCNAASWSVNPKRIGILGFSAGGHLTASAGTHFEALTGLDLPADEVSGFSFRPDALVLCYPVISFGPFGHLGSMENLLGPNPPEDQRAFFSNETQVSPQTPPAFLWHTATDGAVPVENSLMFASALSALRIPLELHVFSDGVHGIGLAEDHPSAAPWSGLCARWLRQQGF